MAWAEKLPSGRWQGRYLKDGKKRSAGTFSYKRDALSEARKLEGERATGTRIHFATVAERWLSERRSLADRSPETCRSYEMHLRARVNPVIGSKEIRQLKPGDLDSLVANLVSVQGLAASTVRQTMTTVRQVLTYAVRNELIPSSPYVGVKIPATPPPTERAFSRDELNKLITATPDSQRDKLNILHLTGMRRGELQALHWEDIDFGRNVIHIRRSFSNTGHRFKSTKGRNTRIVPMNPVVVAIMERLRNTGEYPGVPCSIYPYDDEVRATTGLLFTAENTGPFNPDVFLREVKAAGRVAGIPGNIRLHDLRHTYATTLAKQGVPLRDIQGLLGHTSVAVTERYAKYQQQDFSNIIEALADSAPDELRRLTPDTWEGLPIGPDGEVAGPDEPDEDWHADYLRYGPDGDGPDSLD